MSYDIDFKDLPEEWKWVRLEEVIEDIADGGTPSRDNPEYFNGNITWLVVDDIQRKIIKTRETITAEGLKHSNAKLWKKGTVILSFGATIGEVGIAEIELATKQGIAGIVPQKDKLLNTFLYYVLKHNKHILLRYANQTTIMEVRPSVIKEKFKLPLPPLPEQQKIAEILETVDNAIEKTEKIIEKYKRIKQGLMQDLLTKGIDENGNIRSEKTHKFKGSPLGRIPEEWEVVRLGEVSKTITKGTTPTTYGFLYVNDGINFIKIESIDENGNFITEKFEHIDKKTNDYLSRSKLEEGDILFSIAGALGRVAIIEKSVLPANTNQALAIIRLKEKKETTIKFLKFYLTSFLIQNYIENVLVKSAQSNLTLKHISNFLIPLPPLPEQQRIAEILTQTDQAIEKEQQYKEKLQRTKQGLMQDLLTGKVRVNKLLEVENNELRKS